MSIQTELTRLTNAKAAIKAAIEGKGVTVPNATMLDGMAALIASIQTGINAEEITIAMDASNATTVKEVFMAAMDASDVTTVFVYQGDIGVSTKNNQCLIVLTSINIKPTEMFYARYRNNEWNIQIAANTGYELIVSVGDIYAKVVLQ